jgi:hypothetical protein
MAYKDPLDERARAARRKHYQANKEQYYRRNLEKKEKMIEWVNNFKSNKPCLDCGLIFPVYCMDFDHRDSLLKLKNISNLKNCGNWKKLFEEIEKCDLVCAICHRIRTHNRRIGLA